MLYLLGIDVSTTGAKALLIDEGGRVAAEAAAEYPVYRSLYPALAPGFRALASMA